MPELAHRAAALSACDTHLSALARLSALVREADISLGEAQRAGDAAAQSGHLSSAVGALCAAADAVRALCRSRAT